MKSFAALTLLGVMTSTEAIQQRELTLIRLNVDEYPSAVGNDDIDIQVEGQNDDIDSSGFDASNVQLTMTHPCSYLDETQEELDYQLDMFSRTLDSRYW
jgi:hypothetical protein